MRTSKTPIVLAFLVSATSCVGDAAVKFEGRFVDSNGTPYAECIFSVEYDQRVIGEGRVSGRFQRTIVFHPSSRNPLAVMGTCTGASRSYKKTIDKLPENFADPIDLGDIVLE